MKWCNKKAGQIIDSYIHHIVRRTNRRTRSKRLSNMKLSWTGLPALNEEAVERIRTWCDGVSVRPLWVQYCNHGLWCSSTTSWETQTEHVLPSQFLLDLDSSVPACNGPIVKFLPSFSFSWVSRSLWIDCCRFRSPVCTMKHSHCLFCCSVAGTEYRHLHWFLQPTTESFTSLALSETLLSHCWTHWTSPRRWTPPLRYLLSPLRGGRPVIMTPLVT